MSNVIIADNNIHEFVRMYLTNKQQLPTQLRGLPIGKWDVSKVTVMKELFNGYENFDEPLIEWDVYNVTDMSKMFAGCTKFNQPLSDELYNWGVLNVTNMESMFSGCTNFNQPLYRWDVDSVTDMSSMFKNCTNFNQNLNEWNVSNVTNMSEMFYGASSFKEKPKWKLGRKVNTLNMFVKTPLQDKFRIEYMNFDRFMEIIRRANIGDNNNFVRSVNIDTNNLLQPILKYINATDSFRPKEKKEFEDYINKKCLPRLNAYIKAYPEAKNHVMEIIQFVLSQNSEYKDLYIKKITDEVCNVYGVIKLRCTEGVFERIIMTNKLVIEKLCSEEIQAPSTTSSGNCNPLYMDLYNCFNRDLEHDGGRRRKTKNFRHVYRRKTQKKSISKKKNKSKRSKK
jgi:surface protein